MLYLLDANVVIDADRDYYALDRVPEFWDWLQHQGQAGHVKMCVEARDGRVTRRDPVSFQSGDEIARSTRAA